MKRKIVKISIALFLLTFILFTSSLKDVTHNVLNKIEQKYFLFVSRDMDSFETENFVIKYEDEEEAELTAAIAEKYFKPLSEKFNYEAKGKIPIILHRDIEKMKKTAFMKTQGIPMGLYIGNTIHILSPGIWIKSDKKKAEIFEEEGPIIHEMVHYIVDDITKGNHKEWFFEGISLYTEYLYTGFVIGDAVQHEELYAFDELVNNFKDLDQIKAYYSSFIAIKTLAEENNFEYLNSMLQYLREGNILEKNT